MAEAAPSGGSQPAEESALPRFTGAGGYERYCIPVPAEAAAVPAAWVRAKEERDGATKTSAT